MLYQCYLKQEMTDYLAIVVFDVPGRKHQWNVLVTFTASTHVRFEIFRSVNMKLLDSQGSEFGDLRFSG